MVPMSQVQNGIAKYLDTEIVGKLNDWRKWVVGAAAALILQDFNKIVEQYKGNDFVKMLGVIDEGNNVDVQKLYQMFKAQAQKSPATFNAPLLGTVTLNESDVDKLYHYIING